MFNLKTNNYILLIWCIECVCIINSFWQVIPDLDYLVWMMSFMIFSIKGSFKFNSDEFNLIMLFITLITVQAMGCVYNMSLFAFKNVLSTIMVMIMYMVLFMLSEIRKSIVFNFSYLILIAIALFVSLSGVRMGNTLPACIVFITSCFLLYNIKYSINLESTKNNIIKWPKYIFLIIPIVAAIYIAFFSESRTAFGIFFIILSVNVIFQYFRISKDSLKKTFYYLLVSIVVLLTFYINLSNFSWFNELNFYSQLYFEKNINSGRDYIWSYTFSNMEWWQFIIGSGTGRLPSISRYAESSFHNTFIQLFVQNGIIGLGILIAILRYTWNLIIKNNSIKFARLSISLFIGIIVYNCFECTLIANKAFLGSIQWMALAIAANKNIHDLRKERL